MILATLSILSEFIGIMLLSIYGVPNKKLYDSILLDSVLSEEEEIKIFVRSKYGLISLLFGLILQMGSMIQIIYNS